MAQLTTNALRAKWPGKDYWLHDGGPRGAGRLVARIKRNATFFYFQYFSANGRKFLPLGPFDLHGEQGLSLAAAREQSGELAKLYRSGVTDVHAHVEQQRRIVEQQKARAALARQAEQEAAADALTHAERFSLRKFLTAYVEHLQGQGKHSTKDVANLFKNHVFTDDAALSDRDARFVTTDDFVGLISKVVGAGHGRTAAKVRSYLRAAYALAIRAKTSPAAPQSLRDFGIQVNPLASIDALAQYNRARKRKLSAHELAAFLKRVHAKPVDTMRDALEVCVYLGGQRPTQLLRLRRTDVDLTAGEVTLYDPKGRRLEPRAHLLPVPRRAADILGRRIANLAGDEPVFSTDGRSAMDRGTLTNFVTAIAGEMVKAKESHEPFTLRDLRRTLETLLASWGVSSDARKHLQSHGLGGVQQRHYDQYEYLREKRAALRALALRLERMLAMKTSRKRRSCTTGEQPVGTAA